MIDFFPEEHKQFSEKKRFGICDTPPPPACKAYIDEKNGKDWIATVDNYYQELVTFIPVDNCIEINKPDGTMDNRCDGFLYYKATIIFVELKQRNVKGNKWIKEGEKQLRETIGHFEKEPQSKSFSVKKAYIANRHRPYFRSSQAIRMDEFFNDTRYSLRIENRICID
ncbi:hypothetical protein [Bacteroides heparinolyticus]|uniref:hypothetical protein n=1 Tax=Prevotella heparinolytica TaxID=28113 RepID=UPI0035A1A815